MPRLAILAAVLLSGCTNMPAIDQNANAIVCVRVETLTTSTTVVHIPVAHAGQVIATPVCQVGAEFRAPRSL